MKLSKPRRFRMPTGTLRYVWGPVQISDNDRFYALKFRRDSIVLIRPSNLPKRIRSRYNWEYPRFEWRPKARILNIGKLQFTHRNGTNYTRHSS